MTGQNVGYLRVSTLDQNSDRQLVGIDLDTVFEDKASGKDRHREALVRCLDHLRVGDTLHVHSIDRLARNMEDLLNLVREITMKGVSLRFLKEGLTFSGQEDPMQNLMLHMLGAFSEFERAMIKERQREGIQAAKKRGVQIGAKKKLTTAQVADIVERVSNGEQKKALAEEYCVSRQTLYSAIQLIL